MIELPGWPEDIRNDPEQLKRLIRARHLEPEIAKKGMFGLAKWWKVSGSEPQPYKVSYRSCTCQDFVRRRLPCKHMYYIALREGRPDVEPTLKAPEDRAFHPLDEVFRLSQLLMTGDIKPDQYVPLAVALIQMEPLYDFPDVQPKTRGRSFQPKKEQSRFEAMYQNGDMELESYLSIGDAFREMRRERKPGSRERIVNAVRNIRNQGRSLGALCEDPNCGE